MGDREAVDVDAFIRANARMMKDEEIARQLSEALGRPYGLAALRKRRQRLGLVKEGFRGGFRTS